MSEIEENPYAPGIVQQKHVHTEVEAIRYKHLSHEGAMRSVALFYLVGGVIGNFVGLVVIVAGFGAIFGPLRPDGTSPRSVGLGFLAFGSIVFLYSFALLVVAHGFKKLYPQFRELGLIVAGLGMLFVPIGTIINSYALYLLISKKGVTIFSPEYQKVVGQTPHMKYKTPIVVWIVYGFLMLLIVAALLSAFA